MRLLAHIAVGVLACTAAVAVASASGPIVASDPPTLLTPVSGQTIKAGTSIAFRIRTFAGDDMLWLYVSRSPTIANACGTIAHEVSIWDFSPTADPAVYEAKPTHYTYASFWMNTPGTYYWQAYRIEHAGGADGCVESAVRSFSIVAAAPSPAPKPKPPVPKTPVAPSTARLAGSFDVTTRITSVSGIDVRKGTKDQGVWLFTPQCAAGPCSVRLRYTYRGASFDNHVVRMTLKRSASAYAGASQTPLVECNFRDVRGTMTVRLNVTAGAWIDGRRRATRLTGRYDYAAPETTAGIYRCPAAHITATIRGTLQQ
jgi:hypothetical protein